MRIPLLSHNSCKPKAKAQIKAQSAQLQSTHCIADLYLSVAIACILLCSGIMLTLQGNTRIAFLIFFASHIPITLLVDGQAFFSRSFYPQVLQDVVDLYAATFKVCLCCFV